MQDRSAGSAVINLRLALSIEPDSEQIQDLLAKAEGKGKS